MTDKNYTPMQEVFFQLDTQNELEFKAWIKNNIARLLYEEKYLIIDTYDAAADPEAINQINFKSININITIYINI